MTAADAPELSYSSAPGRWVLAVSVLGSGIAPALGWSSPAVLAMALAGVTGLAVFLSWERHAASPMLPLAIFAERQFASVNAVAFIV